MIRFTSTNMWTRGAGFAAGCAAFLAFSGCQSDKRQAVAPPETPPQLVQAEPLPAPKLYGPRSQESIEECFALPKHVTFNAPPQTASKDTPPAKASAAVLAGAGWDVKLTNTRTHFVIHHSASEKGSAEIFHREHKARGWEGLGYHFVIGNGNGSGDGQVEAGYRWTKQERGAHAGNIEYNEHGIGICLVGNFEETRPTPKQMESLRKLVRFLQVKTGIATNEIIGHQHVPGKDTKCPGKHFDLPGFRASLGAALSMDRAARPVPLSAKR